MTKSTATVNTEDKALNKAFTANLATVRQAVNAYLASDKQVQKALANREENLKLVQLNLVSIVEYSIANNVSQTANIRRIGKELFKLPVDVYTTVLATEDSKGVKLNSFLHISKTGDLQLSWDVKNSNKKDELLTSLAEIQESSIQAVLAVQANKPERKVKSKDEKTEEKIKQLTNILAWLKSNNVASSDSKCLADKLLISLNHDILPETPISAEINQEPTPKATVKKQKSA